MPPPYRFADGAVDCTVVSVVVRDRTEGVRDENVLPSPPPVVGAFPVTTVPALEYPVSDRAVSPFVETVGAVDLALVSGAWLSSTELRALRESPKPCVSEFASVVAFRYRTSEGVPDSGYGLFLTADGSCFLPFDALSPFRLLDDPFKWSADEFFRWVSRFTQLENGRRRVWRSRAVSH